MDLFNISLGSLTPKESPGAPPFLPDRAIMPSSAGVPAFKSQSALTAIVCDERAIAKLLETMIARSGLSVNEVARRMGVTSNTVRQYLHGRRSRPSLQWFVRLATVCGATLLLEHGQRPR